MMFFLNLLACSASHSLKSQYLLAERFWTEGNYAAAVAEFDKVSQRDPKGRLGLQALFRSANTQYLFLQDYWESIRKYRLFIDRSSEAAAVWEAKKQIGEILYTKLELYDQAISLYKALLGERPDAADSPEFLYRIARSEFYLWRFAEALRNYQDLATRFSESIWGEKAAFELGRVYFTQGDQQESVRRGGRERDSTFQSAIESFRRFMKKYPKSLYSLEARFGIASCLEEMDQLDAALAEFSALEESYPSRSVVQLRMSRLRSRLKNRSQKTKS